VSAAISALWTTAGSQTLEAAALGEATPHGTVPETPAASVCLISEVYLTPTHSAPVAVSNPDLRKPFPFFLFSPSHCPRWGCIFLNNMTFCHIFPLLFPFFLQSNISFILERGMAEVPVIGEITKHIYTLRGEHVMLDRDLAALYEVKPI
jgi:hypothetical protein